jgi:hypothetical protein
VPVIELPLAEGVRAIRNGDQPPPDRTFPSREAADAYHVVRAWLRRQQPEGVRFDEARAILAKRYPHLPWLEMQPYAMIKTAARLLEQDA